MVSLSVIVPAYNTEPYLRRCVDSILSSDYSGCEIILVDDGSTDGTGALCDLYEQAYPFIKSLHQKNRGLPSARNLGMWHASGEYLFFVDSDDCIEKKGLKSVMDALLANPSAQAACFGFTAIYGNGEKTERILFPGKEDYMTLEGEDIFYKMLNGPGFVWNKIFKRSLLSGIQFDEKCRMGEDILFILPALRHCKKALGFRELVNISYRERTGNMSGADLNDRFLDYLKANRSFFEMTRASYPSVGISRCFTAAKTVISKIPPGRGYGEYYDEIRRTLRFRPREVMAYLAEKRLRDTAAQKIMNLGVLLCPHCVVWLNMLRHRF